MNIRTAVIYGNAVDDADNERVIRFLDEYEWYARALKTGREKASCDEESPTQQQLFEG